jgi:Mrp family chromosome partitioning ATPase
MPPGTGDVPLTVFQSIPVDGAIIVTSPQDLVKMIVAKAYNMASKMNIPVLGLVENYSYLECPDCGKRINIFGESNIDEVAVSLGLPVLGQMPIMSEMASLSDEGKFDDISNPHIKTAVRLVECLSKK